MSDQALPEQSNAPTRFLMRVMCAFCGNVGEPNEYTPPDWSRVSLGRDCYWRCPTCTAEDRRS